MKFLVEGDALLSKGKRKFAKTIEAPNERVARENALKLIGSAHGSKRSKIVIGSVKKAEE